MIYLAILQVSQKWTMLLHKWKAALNRFSIELGDREPPCTYAFTQNNLQPLQTPIFIKLKRV